jgi:membrane fusion protein, multidrug efflux system
MNPPDETRPHEPSRPEEQHELGFALPKPARVSPTAGVALALVCLLGLGGLFLFGYMPHHASKQELTRSTQAQQQETRRVEVVKPKLLQSGRALVLPASIQASAETVLYPRANGYVERFEVDIGDRVKSGQLLAVIETPELDQQLDAARAQLAAAEASSAQARANRDYSLTSLDRYKRLRPAGVASQQEVDQRSAEAQVTASNVAAADASIKVAEAEIRRLTRVKSYTRVTAPFAGLITQRTIDVGSLVTSGNGSPLFRLIATDPVRVLLQIPQDVAPSVRAGIAATITVREFPGRRFEGKLNRAAFALDAQTRTMLTEVQVPNPSGELLVGMYAEVALNLPVPHRAFEVPATALYNDAKGLRLAIVDAQDKVQFVSITIERDTGATVHVATGLTGEERIVRIANASFTPGLAVEARAQKL